MLKVCGHSWAITDTHLWHFLAPFATFKVSLIGSNCCLIQAALTFFFQIFVFLSTNITKIEVLLYQDSLIDLYICPPLFPTFVQLSGRLLTSLTLSLSSQVTHTASPFLTPPPHPTPSPAAVTVGKQCATPHRPSLKDERASGEMSH